MGKELIMKRFMIVILVLLITPIVISEQSNIRRDIISGRIAPPGIPRGATHEDAFVRALKDPNIYIGVFERPPSNTKLSSGEQLYSLPDIGEAIHRFSPLLCVKSIKGNFTESVIWYCREPGPRGEGSPNSNNIFIAERGSRWILALEKTTSEYRIGRFGDDIKKYPYINNDDVFFNILWYGYGTLCLNWPSGIPEREGIKKVSESMIDDLEAIVKAMPLIQKKAKDPNDTAAIAKTTESLKNDLAKSIFAKLTDINIKKTP
jgi:hypothetical protein